MSLAGLTVLVTRPAGQASGLIAAIEQAGGVAHHIPVLAITALDPDQQPRRVQTCKQLVMDLDHFQQVIFVSTNAVRYGLEWIDDYWPQRPEGLIWHAIGSRTASELMAAGINVSVNTALSGVSTVPGVSTIPSVSTMDSETLIQHPALQQIEDQKILIVRGVNGREWLKEQLSQQGARVSYMECYCRELPEQESSRLKQLLKTPLDIVCVNSGDSLHNLCTLAGGDGLSTLQSKMMVVPSRRVADIARECGFKNTYLAKNASDKAMMAGLNSVTSTEE
jgi:uroporphyrinogen-III synthase